jgi:antitoxin component YwqK of YwqJK toxin-antitoxin module
MKKLFILLFALVSFVSVNAQTFSIEANELDNNIITFVQNHFPDNAITLCFVEYETNRPSSLVDEFNVILDNGTKLEFDRNSKLTSVEGKRNTVPVEILPNSIQNYITTYYPTKKIKSISIERTRKSKVVDYEVDFAHGLELTFNKNGKLINIEHND